MISDTVTHCVCVGRRKLEGVLVGRLPLPLSYPDPVASCTIVARQDFEINTRDFPTLSALNGTYTTIQSCLCSHLSYLPFIHSL